MPISIDTIIEFILYIAPGFLALTIYHSVFPQDKYEPYFYFTWCIINGVSIYYFIKLVDSCLLGNFLHTEENNLNFKLIIALFSMGALVGLLGIYMYKFRLWISGKSTFLKHFAPPPLSYWAEIIMKSFDNWAVIFLDDGSIYLGWIKNFNMDLKSENQDFLLSNAKRVDENLNEMYPVTGIGVYLNTKNIKRIEFLVGEEQMFPDIPSTEVEMEQQDFGHRFVNRISRGAVLKHKSFISGKEKA